MISRRSTPTPLTLSLLRGEPSHAKTPSWGVNPGPPAGRASTRSRWLVLCPVARWCDCFSPPPVGGRARQHRPHCQSIRGRAGADVLANGDSHGKPENTRTPVIYWVYTHEHLLYTRYTHSVHLEIHLVYKCTCHILDIHETCTFYILGIHTTYTCYTLGIHTRTPAIHRVYTQRTSVIH